jgi:hypothetical protein
MVRKKSKMGAGSRYVHQFPNDGHDADRLTRSTTKGRGIKKQTTIMTSPPENHFRKLPAELRNMIYYLVLVGDESNYVRPRKYLRRKRSPPGTPAHWKEPALLQTSKEIRYEASIIHYKNSRFFLSIEAPEMAGTCEWIDSVVERCGPKPFKYFYLTITQLSWEQLRNLLPLAKLFYNCDIVPPTVSRSTDPVERNPAFVLATVSLGYHIAAATDQALILGRKIRVNDGTTKQFSIEFDKWFAKISKTKPARAARSRAKARERVLRAQEDERRREEKRLAKLQEPKEMVTQYLVTGEGLVRLWDLPVA